MNRTIGRSKSLSVQNEQPNTFTIENKKIIIALSGFDSGQRALIMHYVQKTPNLVLEENLSFKVNVLVSNTVWSHKYQAVTALRIPVVTKEWPLACYTQKQLVSYEPYRLGIFADVRVGLLGFTQKEFDSISEFIIDQNGLFTKDINELLLPNCTKTIVVVKRGYHKEQEMVLRQLGHESCDSEWLLQCYQRGYFVPFQSYRIGRIFYGEQLEKENIYETFEHNPLDKAFGREFRMSELSYFRNVIAYINIKEEKLLNYVERYVSLGDGIYVPDLHPSIVTHIITLENKPEFVQSGAFIVHPAWVRDSFYFRVCMVEQDYKVYEKQISRQLFQQEEQIHPLQRHQSFSNTFGIGKSIPFATNTNLLNPPEVQKRSLSFNQFSGVVDRINQPTKSKLFHQLTFYILDTHNPDRTIKQLIKDNGGKAEYFKKSIPNFNEKTKTIILLPDSAEVKPIVAKLTSQVVRVFSQRWVKYCIEKCTLELAVIEKRLLHLLPLYFDTPIPALNGKFIYVGVNKMDDKILFREMATILTGVTISEFDQSLVSYFVTDKQNSKKLKHFDESHIKSPKWLIQVFQSGQII